MAVSAERLKTIGGLVLMLSFVTQYYTYDDWNSRAASIRDAISDQAIIDKSVLLNKLIYLSSHAPAGLSGDEFTLLRTHALKEACRKAALAQWAVVAYDTQSSRSKARLLSAWLAKADRVTDYESCQQCLIEISQEGAKHADLRTLLQDIDQRKARARFVFLALYVLGATLVILGQTRTSSKFWQWRRAA